MRYSTLAAALALALGSISFTAAAQDGRDQEIALLKQQLAELQAQVQALEERTDAQSDVNLDTAQALDKITTDSPKIETKGGIKITSADKKFEAQVGGRIHFDGYAFDRDEASATGTTEFRRARLTLQGKAFGWGYKMEQDFAAGTNLEGLRDLYVTKDALGGKFTIGHFKPYRSMEELTSSNEITMMERPFASATGIYGGRQFQQGVGYLRSNDTNYSFGVTAFNLRSASGPRNEGVGAAARVTFAPINNETSTLHFGGSVSTENANQGSADLAASVAYAGRRGPSQTIAVTTGDSRGSVTTFGLEAAGAFGPLYFQSEYARATFDQPLDSDQDVDTFYVMGSWMLNGGHKVYKPGTGVFGAPKVGDKGLWELTARYDTIENKDIDGMEVSSTLLGLNYYINPNVRVMFNYTRGDNEFNGDKTNQFAVRTQFNF
jgi:phosphate-selective porin OprO and OprP